MSLLTEEQLQTIDDTCGDFDTEAYAYSGRGMFGRRCLGINFDSIAEAFKFALSIGAVDGDLADCLDAPRFDDMGRGIVIYWPSIEFDLDREEDDED
jgi:hypothetical protein